MATTVQRQQPEYTWGKDGVHKCAKGGFRDKTGKPHHPRVCSPCPSSLTSERNGDRALLTILEHLAPTFKGQLSADEELMSGSTDRAQ